MNQRLANRIAALTTLAPRVCPDCRTWPMLWVVGDGDPDPPERCERCGRTPEYAPIRLVGVRIADISKELTMPLETHVIRLTAQAAVPGRRALVVATVRTLR